MPNDTDDIVVASGGSIHIADLGTPLPASLSDTLDPAFVELGFISEDGVKWNDEPTMQAFRAWQRRRPVRRQVTELNDTLAFAMEEWNEDNIQFAYRGGDVTEPAPGEFRFTPASDTEFVEKAMVLRWQDGVKGFQWACARGQVTGPVEVTLAATSLALLPITYEVTVQDEETPWVLDFNIDSGS